MVDSPSIVCALGGVLFEATNGHCADDHIVATRHTYTINKDWLLDDTVADERWANIDLAAASRCLLLLLLLLLILLVGLLICWLLVVLLSSSRCSSWPNKQCE